MVTKGNIDRQKDKKDGQGDADTQQREDKRRLHRMTQRNSPYPTSLRIFKSSHHFPQSIKVLLKFQEYRRQKNRQERKWHCNKLVQQNYWSTSSVKIKTHPLPHQHHIPLALF
jgi:hypothetical protein